MLHLTDLVYANLCPRLVFFRIVILAQADNLDISVIGRGYLPAGYTLTTGRLAFPAVKRLSQIECQRHLAHMRRACEKVSMGQRTHLHRALE